MLMLMLMLMLTTPIDHPVSLKGVNKRFFILRDCFPVCLSGDLSNRLRSMICINFLSKNNLTLPWSSVPFVCIFFSMEFLRPRNVVVFPRPRCIVSSDGVMTIEKPWLDIQLHRIEKPNIKWRHIQTNPFETCLLKWKPVKDLASNDAVVAVLFEHLGQGGEVATNLAEPW